MSNIKKELLALIKRDNPHMSEAELKRELDKQLQKIDKQNMDANQVMAMARKAAGIE